jgi:endonuclease/exonuclease/phosphatase family metal-dependent hydrolase
MARIVFAALALTWIGCVPPSTEPPATDPVIEDDDDGKDDGGLASPWVSRAACEARLAGHHRSARPKDTTRVATWNVRWFPLGEAPFGAGEPSTEKATDVEWLACTVAWMRPDVLVLEEVLASDEAKAAFATLVSAIASRDGAPWQGAMLDCPDPDLQHQALLYRGDRVTLTEAATVSLGEGCSSSLRPALRGRMSIGARSLSLFGLHLKSGSDARSYGLRRTGMAVLGDAIADEDSARTAIALGDFNSMGCSGCTTKVAAAAEITTLADEFDAMGLDRAMPDPECSEYVGSRAGLLDHIAIRGVAMTAHVDGECRALKCDRAPTPRPAALLSLSDHCPQWIDLP